MWLGVERGGKRSSRILLTKMFTRVAIATDNAGQGPIVPGFMLCYTQLTTLVPPYLHDINIFHLIPVISVGRILLRPFPADSLCVLLILLVVLGDIGSQWVVRVGRTQQSLYRQQDCPNLQCRGPFIFQNI